MAGVGTTDKRLALPQHPGVEIVETAALGARAHPDQQGRANPAAAQHGMQRERAGEAAGFARQPRRPAIDRAGQTTRGEIGGERLRVS